MNIGSVCRYCCLIGILFSAIVEGGSDRSRSNDPASKQRRSISNTRPGCDQFSPIREDTTSKLETLRNQMRNFSNGLNVQHGLDAYIIPMDDAHQSEYVSEFDKRLRFISGFTGSAGQVVVTRTKACLRTDSRYELQAEVELDCNWIRIDASIQLEHWIQRELFPGNIVGANPNLMPYRKWRTIQDYLEQFAITLIPVEQDLIDEIWKRPNQQSQPLMALDIKFSGMSWQDKIDRVRRKMSDVRASATVFTALDETAWLFNLRGSDINFTPVFFSYCILEMNKISLYLLNYTSLLKPEIRSHLQVSSDGKPVQEANNTYSLEVKEYNRFLSDLRSMANVSNGEIWIDPSSSYAVYIALVEIKESSVYLQPSPAKLLKAMKNPVEVENMRRSHKRDSAALIEFVAMLEKEIREGKAWTEISAATKLEEMRRQQEHSRGISFDTISSSGPNGAIIHYRPQNATNRRLTTAEMYLLDSGGQYLDGTTDVTRTFHFGEPTEMMKEAYTRVLMGSIDLASVVWVGGSVVYGRDVDVLARRHLWSVGWQYRHGTGHGIGMFLGVHEGPARILFGCRDDQQESPLEPGMFLSDEPGFYLANEFGVRLETILLVKGVETKYAAANQFIGFEPITLVPFEPHLINFDLLDISHKRWLNAYNARIRREIGEEILLKEGKTEAYNWIRARTAPIPVCSGSEASLTIRIPGLICVETLAVAVTVWISKLTIA